MISRIAGIAAILSILVIAAGCGKDTAQPQDGIELSSQVAPDGQGRAFVWIPKVSGTLGATSSQPYQVWVEYAKGDKTPLMILKADATDGVAIRWTGPRELEVCYGPTHIYYFNNLFDHLDQDARQLYRVEIHLRRVQSLSECK